MRFVYNSLLVILGVPLFGTSMLFISRFLPIANNDFAEGPFYIVLAYWLATLIPFSLIYICRSRWMINSGIYNSWGNFKAYFIESHIPPEVTETEIQSYLDWFKPPSDDKIYERNDLLAWTKATYKKIQSDYKDNRFGTSQRNSHIRCLIHHSLGLLNHYFK